MSVAIATLGKFTPVGFGVGGGGAPPIRSIAEEAEHPPYLITIKRVYFEEVESMLKVKLLDDL